MLARDWDFEPLARTPNFFIVGAPKCGTTALHSYLRDHPGIFLPERKEPHYFCTDLSFPPRSAVRAGDEYLGLFDDAPPARITGEASASYLYSDVAVPQILAINPHAKFVAILRNPVDAVYSLHSTLLLNMNEDVPDFLQAWLLQDERLQGRRIPATCTEPRWLQYRAVYSYASQIERLLECAPRGQVLVLIFEEMVADPATTYERVLAFLELGHDGRAEFGRVNANKVYRIGLLNRLVRRPPWPLGLLYGPAKRAANALGLRPRALLENANSVQVPRASLSPAFRRQLLAEFRPDIARLESMLGKPLTAWHA